MRFASLPRTPARVFLAVLLVAVSCGQLKRLAYEGIDREEWQEPDRVIEALELRSGLRVADLGAGGGYFTFRLAEAVGPGGRVLAIDVDRDMTDYLRAKAEERGAANVEVVLAPPDDPRLPDDGVDWVFSVNTYHHLPDRSSYFERVRAGLRPDGRLAIIDFDAEGAGLCAHSTPPEQIQKELEAAGFRLETRHDFLPRQSFQIFAIASP